jgi:arylsulfatase
LNAQHQIFANQKKLGVIPATWCSSPLAGRPPRWEKVSADEKKLFARQAEVAAYTAYTDHEIGR